MEIEVQRSVKAGIREFLKNKVYVRNLILNMIIWALVCMDYQINDYYNFYFPGDTYESTISIATIETLGYIFAGILFEVFTTNKSTKLYTLSFIITTSAALALLFNDRANNYVDMIGNHICKFGIASAFQCCFLTNDLFPVEFSSTTLGICYMMSSISSVLSVYEIYTSEGTQAWELFVGLATLATICALL